MGRMVTVNMHEAKTHLSKLVARAASGEEVIIARADQPLVRLTLIEGNGKRQPGNDRGLVEMAENFDEPLSEFE